MSPEQAAGRLDRARPGQRRLQPGRHPLRLLTGRPPFARPRRRATCCVEVQRGEFPPPRAVPPGRAAALEAVCLKAMALRPEDRYASAPALADDVERWLADEPVSAWREPFAATGPPVAAAAPHLVHGRQPPRSWSALVGLAATVAVQGRANRELRAANGASTRERRQAQARFALAMDAIRTFHTGVSEDCS